MLQDETISEPSLSEPKGNKSRFSTSRISWSKAAVLVAASVTTGVFFIDWCDFIFDCGCESLWTGKAEHCNIKNASPPHCPWCVENGRYGSAAFGAVVIAQAALALRPGSLTRRRIALVFLVFPAAGALAGWLTGLYTGYWTP